MYIRTACLGSHPLKGRYIHILEPLIIQNLLLSWCSLDNFIDQQAAKLRYFCIQICEGKFDVYLNWRVSHNLRIVSTDLVLCIDYYFSL